MRVVVSGGGTGGHIYPAVALVKYIRQVDPKAEFLYIGTDRGLESKIVPELGIPFKTVKIQGFRRKLSLDNFKTIHLFVKAIAKSKEILKEFQPDIVIGTGGYVCATVVYGAHQLGIATMIHEQNSVPGLTNKFLARYVDKIGICFEEAAEFFPKEKVSYTGNPRAQEIASEPKNQLLTEQFGLTKALPTALIFGGSQGALRINEATMELLPKVPNKPYQVLYVTGKRYYDDVMKKFPNEISHVKIVPFISNMQQILPNVSVVVGRAGATSLAEITALGLPSILIPSPNVTNDHQTKNAMSLVQAKAANMIKDQELTGDNLLNALDEILLSPDTCEKMAIASQTLGVPDASERLYQLIKQVIA